MDYFKINGKAYDVLVIDLEENFDILYSENSGRTLAVGSPIALSPLGTFFGHKVTIRRKTGFEEQYDELYDLISKPRAVINPETDGLLFEIAHNQDVISYRGYVSNGGRKLSSINRVTNKVYWGELTLNIVPIIAQVMPDE